MIRIELSNEQLSNLRSDGVIRVKHGDMLLPITVSALSCNVEDIVAGREATYRNGIVVAAAKVPTPA